MGRTSSQLKIRKGDTVEVLSGKDRGKRGTVERVIVEKRRVVVEGVNIVKRHTKPRPVTNARDAARQQQTGGVIEAAAPIDVSNVALVSPGSGKHTRVGYRIDKEGRKVRISRRDGIDLDDTKSARSR
jgi:large subunit ribosomal protein L24